MSAFNFQRLDVYKAAVQFTVVANAIIERLARGNGYLVDQLQRAATSITLNIAQGAGEAEPAETARFYRIARRSAFECAAALDVLAANRLADDTELRNGYALLERIGAMLTHLLATTSGADPVRETLAAAADAESGAARLDEDADADSDSPALD